MNSRLPLISICIPTYNRHAYLKECINCIIDQEWYDSLDIEIVISDNASTDETKKTVETFQKVHSNIHYFRNDENIGANRNLFRASEYARGMYIWFMWDDDIILPQGLKKVLSALQSKENIVLFHTNKTSKNISSLREDGVIYWKELVSKNQAHSLATFLLFLSMVIVRREDFITYLEKFKKSSPEKLGESFSHFYILIACIYQRKILLLEDLVRGGDGNKNDKKYFKNTSSQWYKTVITQWIDPLCQEKDFFVSVWISISEIQKFRSNFIKIYRYMQVWDILKKLGVYSISLKVFRKLFRDKM